MEKLRPHVLGIDDGPFLKGQSDPVPIVGVMMEGRDLVEGVATGTFPVDGADVTDFLAAWIAELRTFPALQAVMLGGITIAGLSVVDSRELSRRLGTPVIVVTRRDPAQSRVNGALEAAGFAPRRAIVDQTPRAVRSALGLYVAPAGIEMAAATRIVAATVRKGKIPEPLRIAHLIARAIVDGESRGRA